MAKRSIGDWDPEGIKSREYYSDESFQAILSSTKIEIPQTRALKLRRGIENAAAWFVINSEWGDKPPPSTVLKQLGLIESAAARLLSALMVPPRLGDIDNLPPALKSPLEAAANIVAEEHNPFDETEDAGEPAPIDIPLPDGSWMKHYHGGAKLHRAIKHIQFLQMTAGIAWDELDGELEAKKAINPDVQISVHQGDKSLNTLVLQLANIYEEAFDRKPGISRPSAKNDPDGPWLRFLQACLQPLEVDDKSQTLSALRERWRRLK